MTRRGVTLIEIMIVVTLVGILAAVVIPSIADQTGTYDVTEQARRVHTEVARLRGRAVAEKNDYELKLSEGQTIEVVRVSSDGTKTVMHEETLENPASATLNDATSGTITFYPTGRVDAAGNLRITGGSTVREIQVLASGMVRWDANP